MIRLPYFVEVQERVEESNAEGDTVFSFRTVEMRRANLESLKGTERVQGTAVQGTVTHRVTLRNGGREVVPKDRIVFRGKKYEIDGVTRDFGRPGKQVATVVEVV